DALKAHHFKTLVGPGVYDIHSPRIPSVKEIQNQLEKILDKLPIEQVWVNPDCGLKTRGNAETIPSLRHLVEATRVLRKEKVEYDK
ncbi:MAG: 5-methyltetrahydropteroyltriglutamate--homocysteine S-methyltransferase, partial [Lactococcus lactis]|nr:5-methyltetrahydropteroyltriglutamate--homocysteine S-methyltransferase [Lactococcus lactis]